MGSHACVSSKPSGWWCVLLFLFPSFSSFFFSSFFLSFLFFFLSSSLFPSPPLPSLSSFLSFLSQTRTDLPAVLRRSLRFFAASQKTSRFAFWPLPPLASPIPLPTASPRFRSVSPLDFSASPSLPPSPFK